MSDREHDERDEDEENPPQGANSGHLVPKKEVAAFAIAAGRTAAEAAQQARAGERSVKRWLGQPAFIARVNQLRGEMTSRGLGILIEGMTASAAVLCNLALNARSEMCRLGAARSVLELSMKVRESVELEARISALEEAQAQREARESPLGNGRSRQWP